MKWVEKFGAGLIFFSREYVEGIDRKGWESLMGDLLKLKILYTRGGCDNFRSG